MTGTEVYTREVCSRLPAAAPELGWRFFASRPRAGLGMDVMVMPFRRLWSQVRLPLALASERPDLLFVPAHAVPFAWPRKALTVVHDLAFERYPHAYSPGERAYLRLTTRWAAVRCPLLITVSESTKADLGSAYGVRPDRIRVVPLGASAPEVRAAPVSRLAELGLNGTSCCRSVASRPGKTRPRRWRPSSGWTASRSRWRARRVTARWRPGCASQDAVASSGGGINRPWSSCTSGRPRSSCQAFTRDSAFPCSRRWRGARLSWRPRPLPYPRSVARRPSTSTTRRIPSSWPRCWRSRWATSPFASPSRRRPASAPAISPGTAAPRAWRPSTENLFSPPRN